MRLFVALDLPWVVRERLSLMAGSGIPGARWVSPDNYHLTLRFIGETQAHRAEDVDLALAGIRARRFALALAGVGTFTKGGRMTSLWVGIERNVQLDHLQNKIETALQRIGLAPERRRFSPHVTLARLDNPLEARLAGFVQAHNLFRMPSPCLWTISPCSPHASVRSSRSMPRKRNTRWARGPTIPAARVRLRPAMPATASR